MLKYDPDRRVERGTFTGRGATCGDSIARRVTAARHLGGMSGEWRGAAMRNAIRLMEREFCAEAVRNRVFIKSGCGRECRIMSVVEAGVSKDGIIQNFGRDAASPEGGATASFLVLMGREGKRCVWTVKVMDGKEIPAILALNGMKFPVEHIEL